MSTPQIIKARRLELGWSQPELARRVSAEIGYKVADAYGQSAVSRWESEGPMGRPLTSDVLTAMATVLELDLLELLGGDPVRGTVPLSALSTYPLALVEWSGAAGSAVKLTNGDGSIAAELVEVGSQA